MLGAQPRSMKPSHWLHGRCCVRSAATTALRASCGGGAQPGSARAISERASSCWSPRVDPSAAASNGDASTSMQTQMVENIANGPPRGGVARSPAAAPPQSSLTHASSSGAGEQKPRRIAFWSCDAGSLTPVSSEVSRGNSDEPPSATRADGARIASASAPSPPPKPPGDAPPEGSPRDSSSAETRSRRGAPRSTGGASRVAPSRSAHSTVASSLPPPSPSMVIPRV